MGNYGRDNRGGGRSDFNRGGFRRQSFGGRGGGGGGDRQMHRAVCSNCGKDCEVPFRPTGAKPVYCSECFEKMGGGNDSGRFQDRGPRRDNYQRQDSPRPQNNEQLDSISHKLDKIIEMLGSCCTPKAEKEEKVEPILTTVKSEEATAPKKAVKSPRKKVSATEE